MERNITIVFNSRRSNFGYHKYLMSWINRKLDKELYDLDRKSMREWSDERDKDLRRQIETPQKELIHR